MNKKSVYGWVICIAWFSFFGDAADKIASRDAVQSLDRHLKTAREVRPNIKTQNFLKIALTKVDAVKARNLLWADRIDFLRKDRSMEMKSKVIRHGDLEMPFEYFVYGDKPKDGRSLFISMHGGGNTPKRVNDSQWENQKRLYRPKEGVYLAPRAPTDTWNLWHQGHIDPMFLRLIENMVALEEVNPNRVYLMGYSAGGDGVYQLAPRMAYYLAAAAMMAGHPNETSPLGLRNLPFAIHVGERDGGFNRNKVAIQWKHKLEKLNESDPKGYIHYVRIHAGRGHWMNREDAVAVEWMAKYNRNPYPQTIVWKQDDVLHDHFYWISLSKGQAKAREEIKANIVGQEIRLEGPSGKKLDLNLNDDLIVLDKAVIVSSRGKILFKGKVSRTVAQLSESLELYKDRDYIFSSKITVKLP